MKRNWKLYRNTYTAQVCWQLYYDRADGRKRYYNPSLDYPTAAALRECLEDDEIRKYAVEHEETGIFEQYAYTKANWSIFSRMREIENKYKAKFISESMIYNAIKCESDA